METINEFLPLKPVNALLINISEMMVMLEYIKFQCLLRIMCGVIENEA